MFEGISILGKKGCQRGIKGGTCSRSSTFKEVRKRCLRKSKKAGLEVVGRGGVGKANLKKGMRGKEFLRVLE